jgi:antitoxin HicB
MRYPLTLRPDQNGTLVVQAVDVPSALTVGRDEADAIAQAADALMTLFAHPMAEGEPMPRPSPKRGQPCAILPPIVAAKLAIYEAMRAAGLTQTALAERLGCDPRQIQRLLDLDHASRPASSGPPSPPSVNASSSTCRTPLDSMRLALRPATTPCG